MIRKKIRLPRIGAEEIMNDLGNIDDGIEFVDLTKSDYENQRNYAMMIERCDEIEKKLMYLYNINSNFDNVISNYHQNIFKYKSVTDVTNDIEIDQKKRNKYRSCYFDEIENEVMEDDKKLRELTNLINEMNDHLFETKEKLSIFIKVSQLVSINNDLMNILELYITYLRQGPK